jgi:crotonobetainyl-CoA:carnitine CoA-transferase CaiB-like acyl-CoA transferase
LTCRLLADLGAEVIRIDSPAQRIAVEAAAQTGTAARGGYGTAKHNRNKLGLSINLNEERGKELVRRLVAKADVLVENFSSRVMPNFGLGYETLRRINPGLVMMVMPGFGSSGPYRDYSAYGPSIEPMIGLASLTGYPDGPPSSTGLAYPDCVAGVTGAAAIMVALAHQRATGQGQFIDLSQVESTVSLLGEYFLAYQASGVQPPRIGNRHPVWSPQGTYRCQGEDDWLSVSVQTDAQWRALRAVVGGEAMGGADLETVAGRRANADRIDAAIAAWAAGRDKFAAMATLQAAGVPAGAVLNAQELVEDPHLNARGFFVAARTLEGPTMLMPGTPVRVHGRTRDDWTAAPLPGEHNRQVLRDLLGLADSEIDRLETDGVLGSFSLPRAV